jgi:putative ABC transport system substrate-binding protein
MIPIKKGLLLILVAIILLAGLVIFSSKNKVSRIQTKIFKVGITQPISHPGIDVVRDGIVAGFAANGYKNGVNIIFDFQNAQGEASVSQSIAQKFANSNYDLFIPIGTQSSQSLANLIKDKPIVFAAVTDSVTAGLLKSKEIPGGNITGTSDMILYKEQLELLIKLKPEAKKVGVLNNPSESNSQFGLQETKKFAKELGLEIITAPVNNTGEVLSAARSIVNKVDAFYVLSDNTVIAGQDALIKVAIGARKPLIGVEQGGVEKGALATMGINYFMLGERTAELAIRILKGEAPGKIPVYGVKEGDLFINAKTAKAINLIIPGDLLKEAKQVYQ